MSHKPETLNRIVSLLEEDYPSAAFKYALDTTRLFDGSRMYPDVQIFAPDSQVPACVVEIGYTRPEKLSHYKKLGIPDIRWYGRDNGKLYSYGSLEPVSRKISLQYKFKPHAKDVWRSVLLETGSMCVAAFNAFYDLREKLKAAPTRYKKLRGMVKALRHDPVLQNHRDFFSSRDLRVALTGDDPEDFWTVMENALDVDVFNTVWSNGYGIIVLRYCDVCGETCIDDQSYTDEAWFAIEEEFKSYESFIYRNKKAMERLINQWGVPATVAKAESEKTVTELIDHLEECSLEHAPLIFDQSLQWAKRVPWIPRGREAAA